MSIGQRNRRRDSSRYATRSRLKSSRSGACNNMHVLPVVLFASFAMDSTARAESLSEALAATYSSNTTLNAARANLKATDENVPRALALGRPTIAGTVDFIFTDDYENSAGPSTALSADPSFTSDGSSVTSRYSLTLNQPLFRGFSVVSAVREAKAEVYAGRSDLYQTEQTTLQSGVSAYMGVLRDQSIVGLRRRNVDGLLEQLQGTQERFDAGDSTKTDVGQATARHARAQSDLSIAEANLKLAYAEYKRVIGREPAGLAYPVGIESLLPKSLDDAIEVSAAENPTVAAAIFREEASRYAVKRIRGELLPQVDLNLAYARTEGEDNPLVPTDDLSVTARVTVPLYQGGDVYARLRQSEQLNREQRLLVAAAKDQARTDVVQAWSRLVAERSRLKSGKVQVDANEEVLIGIREQEKIGERSTLDVLDAEQEYVDAAIALVTTRSDVVIASFDLLSAMGRATAMDLGLSVTDNGPQGAVAEGFLDSAQDSWYEFTTSWVPGQ